MRVRSENTTMKPSERTPMNARIAAPENMAIKQSAQVQVNARPVGKGITAREVLPKAPASKASTAMKPVAMLQHSVNHAPQEHTQVPPDFHRSHNAMDAPLEPMEMRSKVQILRLVRNVQKDGMDLLLTLHKS